MSIPMDKGELERRFSSQDPAVMSVAAEICNEIATLPARPEHRGVRPRALIVGGFVRDALLGLAPSDVDMQVYGVVPAALEDLLARRFPVRRVGKQYEILKVEVARGLSFDVSIPRRGIGDSFTPHEAGDPSLDAREAAELRDFTINTLAADPLTGEVLDYWGGLEDLRAKRLRVTRRDTFVTRGLHVYRAAQFSARMGVEADGECRAILRTMVSAGLPGELTPRVVTEELKKLMLKGASPSLGLRSMIESGLIERYYPEIAAARGSTKDEAAWLALCDRAKKPGARLDTQRERLICHLAAFLYPLRRGGPDELRESASSLLSRLSFSPTTGAAATSCLSALPEIERLFEKSREPPPPPQRSSRVASLPGMARMARTSTVRDELCAFLDGLRPAPSAAILAICLAGGVRPGVAAWLDGQLSASRRPRRVPPS